MRRSRLREGAFAKIMQSYWEMIERKSKWDAGGIKSREGPNKEACKCGTRVELVISTGRPDNRSPEDPAVDLDV